MRDFLIIFLLKRFDTQYLLISACSGPFLVNNRISNLGLGIFLSGFFARFFMVESKNKVIENSKNCKLQKKNI